MPQLDPTFIDALNSARDRLAELNTPLPSANPVREVGPFETAVEPVQREPEAPSVSFPDLWPNLFGTPSQAPEPAAGGAFEFGEPVSSPPVPERAPPAPLQSVPGVSVGPAFDFGEETEQPKPEKVAAEPPLGILGESFGILDQESGKPSKEQKEWLKSTREEAQSTIQRAEQELESMARYMPENADTKPAYDAVRGQIEDAKKKLATVDDIVAGKAPLPTKTAMRSGVENVAQSLGTTLIASPVKYAGIMAGYLGKASQAGPSMDIGSNLAKLGGMELSALGIVDPAAPPDENEIYKVGKQIEDFAKAAFPGDPARADEFGQKLAHGAGSLAAFYGSAGVSVISRLGPKAFHTIANKAPYLLGMSLGGVEQFEGATQKMKEGEDVSEEDRLKATLLGTGLGATEALPVTSTTKALGAATKGGKATERVGRVVQETLKGAGEEAAQEFGQSVGADVVAKTTYDPEREIGETAAEEGVIGAILGAGARGGGAAVKEATARKKPAAEPSPEPEAAPEAPVVEEEAAPVEAKPVQPEPEVEEEAAEDVFEELPDEEVATAAKPATVEKASDLDDVAAVVDTEPSEAQKEAGNYRKASVNLTPKGLGLKVAIETPKGAERRGKDEDGKEWKAVSQAHYGYIKGVEGKDGDAVDIYVGPELKSQQVTVVNQIDPKTGRFDEHKAIYGFKDQAEAEKAYRGSFSDKADRVGSIHTVPVEEFKAWLKDGDKTKEFAPAKSQSQTAIETIEAQTRQEDLTRTITELGDQLSASEWKDLGKEIMGRSYPSGKQAREAIHNHYSNRLLLDERIEQVKTSFGEPKLPGDAKLAVRKGGGGEVVSFRNAGNKGRLSVLNNQITDLQQQIDGINEEIAGIQEKDDLSAADEAHVNDLYSQIDGLNEQLDPLLGEAGALESRQAAAQDDTGLARRMRDARATERRLRDERLDLEKQIEDLEAADGKDFQSRRKLQVARKRLGEVVDEEAATQAEIEAMGSELDDVQFALRGFYSPAIRAVQNMNQKKGTGEQFWKQITKAPGVRKDELEWMGLEEFLSGKKSITKDQVLTFMRAHQVELDERILEGIPVKKSLDEEFNTVEWAWDQSGGQTNAEVAAWLDNYIAEAEAGEFPFEVTEEEFADLRYTREMIASGEGRSRPDTTKFSGAKVPGGENYRELLIRLPELAGGRQNPEWLRLETRAQELQDQRDAGTISQDEFDGEYDLIRARQEDLEQKPRYESTHFEDQEIVHLRVDDRVGPNGEKVLFINEIQSDLHQQGRREGYGSLSKAERERLSREYEELRANPWGERTGERIAELRDVLSEKRSRVPSAPFKGDLWLELALKRALLYAAEGDYDAVSWARSDQIAKAVGAEPESLAIQYDQKIGKFLNKYTKKWGGKVEKADIGIADAEGNALDTSLMTDEQIADAATSLSATNPILPITPEMRASVLAGQPLAVGSGQRGYRMTPEAANNREKIFADIEAEIARMAPGIKARFKDLPEGVEGAFSRNMATIYVALRANDPQAIGDHEVIHAARALNLINEQEWNTLKKAADKNNWIGKHNVEADYSELMRERGLSEPEALDQMIEEAVAWEFSEWRKGKRPASTAWQRIMQRLNAFINRIMKALKLSKIEVFEQVFEQVERGPVARQRDLERERMEARNRAALADRVVARFPGLSVGDAMTALRQAEARFALSGRPKIDTDIVTAYQKALVRNKPGNKWVYLEDLRKELSGYSREDVDAALKRLMVERVGGVTAVDLTIQDDQGSLTEGQRAAATRFGASRQDMISIDPGSPLLNQNQAQERTPELGDDDIAWALTGRRNPTSAVGRAYEEFYDGYAGLEPESRRYMRNRARGYFQRAAGAFGSQLQSTRITWQDNFLPVRRLQEAQKREQKIDLPEEMQPYLREELYHSRLQTRIEDFEESHVEPLKKAIADSGIELDQLELYLYARHAEERNKQIASINPKMPDGGSGMTTADANIILQSVKKSKKAKDYERIAKMIYAINDAKLTRRVEYGLMTQDEADTLRNTYKDYIPLKGDPQHDEERTPPRVNIPKGFSVTNKDMVRAMGRQSRARDLISRSVQDYLETMVRGERNRVAQALYDMLKTYPMPEVAVIDTPKMKRFIDKRTGMKTALVANAPVQTAKQFKEMVREQSDPLAFLDPDTMSVMVAGERHTIRFLQPELRDAVMNMGVPQGMGLMKAAWAFNRFIAMTATSLNPSFALPNFMRDFQAAGINLTAAGHKKAFRRVMGNSLRAMKSIIAVETGKGKGQWADLYRELKTVGGTTGFYSLKDWEKQQSQLERDVRMMRAGLFNPERQANAVWRSFKDVVGGFNNIFENATRLAAYKIAIDEGLSKEKAASIAKNITVNFNRRGRLDSPASKLVLSMYLFANPSIQGSHRLAQAFKDATPGRRYGILASLVGLGALTALYNILIGAALGDDEEKNIYETTSDYDRANNWMLLNPFSERKEGVTGRDMLALKVPMPYGYGALVNWGRIAMEYAVSQNSDLLSNERTAGNAFAEMVSIAHGHFDPLGAHPQPLAAFSPTLMKPFVEMATNTKFHGGPVYPMKFDPSDPDVSMSFRTTPQIFKDIARSVNELGGGDDYHKGKLLGIETDFSPETLRHLWTFVIGGVGNEAARLYTLGEREYVTKEPIRLNDIPIIRRFVSDEVGWGYGNDYYAIRDERMKPFEDVRRDAAKGSDAAKEILPTLELEKRLYGAYKKADKILSKYRKDIKANDKARDDGKIKTEVWARRQQDIYDLRQLATMRFLVEYYAESKLLDLEKDESVSPSRRARVRSFINRRRERGRYNISAIEQSIRSGTMHGKPPISDLSKLQNLAEKLRESGGAFSPIAELVD